MNEQDRTWAQTICLKHLDPDNERIVASTVTALSHIARKQGELDMNSVIPALNTVKAKYPALEALVADTLDDVEMFI
ncbi:hypothetical protein ACYZT4_08425 [Pseudomonas sp. GB2N2]